MSFCQTCGAEGAGITGVLYSWCMSCVLRGSISEEALYDSETGIYNEDTLGENFDRTAARKLANRCPGSGVVARFQTEATEKVSGIRRPDLDQVKCPECDQWVPPIKKFSGWLAAQHDKPAKAHCAECNEPLYVDDYLCEGCRNG